MREQSIGISPVESLPALIDASLDRFRHSRACALREAGHWRWVGSEEFRCEVRRMALGLRALGVTEGARVAILGDPCPAWLISDLAIMAAGGISMPLFPSMSAEHFLHAITRCTCRNIILIGGANATLTWRLAEPELGRFKAIVVRSLPQAVRGGHIHGWHDVLEHGDAAADLDPASYPLLLSRLRSGDPATIIHTSGSTGVPKGVVLTHGNLVGQVAAAAAIFPLEAGRDPALSCLPFAHIFERIVVYTYLAQGAPVHIADDVKLLGILLRDVRPAVMTAVPRLLEKLHARIRAQIAQSVSIRRQLGTWAVELAVRQAPTMREQRGGHPWALRVADRLILSRLRQALGGRFKYLIVGGSALSNELQRFLVGVGLPVFTGYGMTEASPVIAVNRPGAMRLGTVGQAFPGVEIRIAQPRDGSTDGEILARGPGIMRGYFDDPAATAATVDGEGWLHTGDLGRLDDDGYLTITGRCKDLCKTANGKYVAPTLIEQALVAGGHEAGGLVDQAMVVAEGQPCVGALLFPDPEALRRRKHDLGCDRVSDEEFARRPEVAAELAQVVQQVNAHLDHWEQVRCWRFVPVPPSIERDELTPTLKLRRHILTRRYHDLIDTMYAERPPAETTDP